MNRQSRQAYIRSMERSEQKAKVDALLFSIKPVWQMVMEQAERIAPKEQITRAQVWGGFWRVFGPRLPDAGCTLMDLQESNHE